MQVSQAGSWTCGTRIWDWYWCIWDWYWWLETKSRQDSGHFEYASSTRQKKPMKIYWYGELTVEWHWMEAQQKAYKELITCFYVFLCEWRCHCICWCLLRGSGCLFAVRGPASSLCIKITEQHQAKLFSVFVVLEITVRHHLIKIL